MKGLVASSSKAPDVPTPLASSSHPLALSGGRSRSPGRRRAVRARESQLRGARRRGPGLRRLEPVRCLRRVDRVTDPRGRGRPGHGSGPRGLGRLRLLAAPRDDRRRPVDPDLPETGTPDAGTPEPLTMEAITTEAITTTAIPTGATAMATAMAMAATTGRRPTSA